MFYKYANFQKFLSTGSIRFKDPNMAIHHRFRTKQFLQNCLNLSQFGNAVTSWILGFSLSMLTGL
jgi:hypothetical protein